MTVTQWDFLETGKAHRGCLNDRKKPAVPKVRENCQQRKRGEQRCPGRLNSVCFRNPLWLWDVQGAAHTTPARSSWKQRYLCAHNSVGQLSLDWPRVLSADSLRCLSHRSLHWAWRSKLASGVCLMVGAGCWLGHLVLLHEAILLQWTDGLLFVGVSSQRS